MLGVSRELSIAYTEVPFVVLLNFLRLLKTVVQLVPFVPSFVRQSELILSEIVAGINYRIAPQNYVEFIPTHESEVPQGYYQFEHFRINATAGDRNGNPVETYRRSHG